MNLDDLNERLRSHFSGFNRARGLPIFALEHGLTSVELSALKRELRSHISITSPSDRHQLAWIVYAAEIGYGYAGDEYWQTFEDKTPGWISNGRRDWIRDAFVAFQKRFAGAKPSGRWAEQFSIIAWPITHAILPRDLQQQLAQVLYDLRHSFSAELFEEPQRLGDFIAARSWNTSARFRNLVQAPALVGQIAAALLLQGREGFEALLHPMTLKRIGDDVDRERRGREWLLGARRAAEERAKIRGLTIGRSTTTTPQLRDEARAEVTRLGLEPRLVMRPIEGARWEAALEIPDLSHLLLRFPQVRDVLAESRCTVAGAAGRPLARGRCLHGPQRVPLSRWPRPDDVLLQFERSVPQLEYLLRAECMLRPGSSWLFKVASDGLAYESRGMRVRAGARYLLVSTEAVRSSIARRVELTCEGVHAALLDVPTALTSEWEQALRDLEVTQAKSIEVWPAGLSAVAWDDEGRGEWLASETPTLAIRSDHAMDELTIAMGDGPSLSLSLAGTPPGEPIFVELPPLAVGLHKFRVAARSGRGADSEVIGDLDVVMRVREARPWSPGTTTHGPLEVELDPAAPSLEQLWEGRASICVHGPAGRQVKCRVRLFARIDEAASFEGQLPPVRLPLSNEEWSRHFEHIKSDRETQRVYDEAQLCEVEFSADELGVFTLRCEREFTPLRWTVRRDSTGLLAQLRDDAGHGTPIIERYSFERPAIGEAVPGGGVCRVPRDGGLYVATLGGSRVAIITPPIVKDLSELRCAPRVDVRDATDVSIKRLLSLARLWGEARVSGDLLAGARQRLVLQELAARIAALLGGGNWSRHEEDYSRGKLGLRALRRAIPHRVDVSPRDPDEVFPHDALNRLAPAPLHERGAAFVAFVAQLQGAPAFGPKIVARRSQSLAWLAEFALRIASDAGAVEGWAGDHAEEGIQDLRDTPVLIRAARFLVLAIHHHKKKRAASGEIFAGWRWS